MKQTGKKILSMLICAALLLGMAACGSGSAAAGELSADVIEADVREYITTIVDSGATITSFSHTQNSISSTEMEVICMVAYSSAGASGTGSFTLSYEFVDGVWTLGDLTADFSDAAAVAASDGVPGAEGTGTEGFAAEGTVPAQTSHNVKTDGVLIGYAIEQAGTLANQGDMGIDNGIMISYGEDGATLYSGTGAAFDGKYYTGESIGAGLFVAGNSKTEVNSYGLLSIDGDVLIPCEAAVIEWFDCQNGLEYGRYLRVVYGTGETTNEDECFFDAGDQIYSAEDGNTMYTGYAKVYDTVNRRFVGEVRSTNPSNYDYVECGDHFTITDAEGITYLYDCEGNVVMQTAKCYDVGNGYIIVRDEGSYDVYDENGTYRFSSASMLVAFDSTSGLMYRYDDSVNSGHTATLARRFSHGVTGF